MIQTLIIFNPVTNTEETWNIEIRNLEYNNWERSLIELKANSNRMAFEYYLNSLNPQIYNDKLYYDTTSVIYNDILNNYFRRLYTITDYIEYNYWFDKLINRIQENIIFEYNFKISHTMKEGPVKTKKVSNGTKKPTIPNKWVRHETADLFDGKTTYIYENLKTGEQMESDNPDLLNELNAKHKKKTVSYTKFSFSFSKK